MLTTIGLLYLRMLREKSERERVYVRESVRERERERPEMLTTIGLLCLCVLRT
jgi:hypothetical protein